MIAFIGKYRARFGVEFLCRTMCAAVRGFLTSRGYRAAKTGTPSYCASGGRSASARPHVSCSLLGCVGGSRSEKIYAAKCDPKDQLTVDRVKRQFTPFGPRQLLVCDITYLATWSRSAYVSFGTDVCSRRIACWNVASTMQADVLPLQELEMAAWQSGGNSDGLIHDRDHGSNCMSMVYTDRGAEHGTISSTGTVGDSYDNSMAELTRQQGPGKQ